MTRSLGIDPGVEGYLTLVEKKAIDVAEAPPRFWAMPVHDGDKAGEGDDLDSKALLEILHEVKGDVDVVVMEKQQAFGGSGPKCRVCFKPKNQQGVASTGKTMKNAGVIEGMALALGLPLVLVRPGEWKPVWGLSKDKSLSTAKAQFLSPNTDWRPTERAVLLGKDPEKLRVASHDKAESFILAKHGIRLLNGKK